MLGRAKRATKVLLGVEDAGGDEGGGKAGDGAPGQDQSDVADTRSPTEDRHSKSSAQYLRTLIAEVPLRVDNLIDVGVNVGTPQLYNAFEHSNLVLVEPSIARRTELEDIVARRGAVWIEKGAGSSKSTLTLIEDLENTAVTSFNAKTEHAFSSGVVESREVAVDTLDNMLAEHGITGRHFLKIDTEGHELEVLLGAEKTLRECAGVMMEVSVTERYVDGYRFSDIITTMRSNGFELYDVLFVAPEIQLNKRTKFIDALFVPMAPPD